MLTCFAKCLHCIHTHFILHLFGFTEDRINFPIFQFRNSFVFTALLIILWFICICWAFIGFVMIPGHRLANIFHKCWSADDLKSSGNGMNRNCSLFMKYAILFPCYYNIIQQMYYIEQIYSVIQCNIDLYDYVHNDLLYYISSNFTVVLCDVSVYVCRNVY